MLIGGLMLLAVCGTFLAIALFYSSSNVNRYNRPEISEYVLAGLLSIPAGICAVVYRERPSKAKVCIGLLLSSVIAQILITAIYASLITLPASFIVVSVLLVCVCILCYVGAFYNVMGTDSSGCPKCKSSMCDILSVKKVVNMSMDDSPPGCLDVLFYGILFYLLKPMFSWFWRLLTRAKEDEHFEKNVNKCKCNNCGKVYKYVWRS